MGYRRAESISTRNNIYVYAFNKECGRVNHNQKHRGKKLPDKAVTIRYDRCFTITRKERRGTVSENVLYNRYINGINHKDVN